MSLNNIECTCPQCGAEFTLDKAIEERALAKVQEEFDALNDKHVQEKIEAMDDMVQSVEIASFTKI